MLIWKDLKPLPACEKERFCVTEFSFLLHYGKGNIYEFCKIRVIFTQVLFEMFVEF